MLKVVFFTIIIYILIQHVMDYYNELKISANNETKPTDTPTVMYSDKKTPDVLPIKQPQEMTFNDPKPWTKIVNVVMDEYPYHYYIKIKIPSLNDYNAWKQIIPNINFDPQTGELIIPSKDEASALAIANLIIINFSGQMTVENILNNNLIQISISKAKAHKVVQNKLREQIMESLYGNKINNNSSYSQDLAQKGSMCNSANNNSVNDNQRLDFTNNGFTDTFQHFSTQPKPTNDIMAFDGSDYTYL